MQRTRLRTPAALLCSLLIFALLSAANAATVSTSPAPVDAQVAIESLRTAVTAGELGEAQRDAILAQLDAAAEDERAAENARRQVAALRAEAAKQSQPEEPSSETLADDGERALQEWTARVPPSADAEMLEDLLERQRNLSAELAAQIEAVETELAQILARPADTAIEIAALRRQAEGLAAPIQAAENEPGLATDARRLRQSAELHRVEAELELVRAEQETSLERQRQRELALREMGFRQRQNLQRIEWLQARIADRGRKELEQRIAELEKTEASVTKGSSVAASVAHDNRLLGDELLQQSDRLAQDRTELSRLEPARDRVATALKDSRTRLELGGASEAVGRWLWSERRRLELPIRLRLQLEEKRRELAELRLRLVTQSDEQDELANIPAAAQAMLEARQAEADDDGTTALAGAALEPLLRERAELLALLEPVLQRRVKTLERSESALQEQIETTQALRQLLDRYLLWTPSHSPLDCDLVRTRARGLLGPGEAVPLGHHRRARPRGDPRATVPLDHLPASPARRRRAPPARPGPHPRARSHHPPDRRGPHRRHAGRPSAGRSSEHSPVPRPWPCSAHCSRPRARPAATATRSGAPASRWSSRSSRSRRCAGP